MIVNRTARPPTPSIIFRIENPSMGGISLTFWYLFISNNSFNHGFTRNDTEKSQRGKSGEMLKRENASRKRESTKTRKGSWCFHSSRTEIFGARRKLLVR